jgi:hypothetical protein
MKKLEKSPLKKPKINMKKILLLLVFCCCSFALQAQDDELSPPTLDEMADEALKKVRDLGVYIQTIVDKDNSIKDRERAIDIACALFANEDTNQIQTRVEMQPKKYKDFFYKIRAYFKRIYLLQYDKVEIEWYEVGYLESLKKMTGEDKYYGTIIIKQRFKGITKDKQKPDTSIVQKTIQVVLEKQTITTETTRVKWIIRLGNIAVTENN